MLGTVLGGGTFVRGGGETTHVLARVSLDRAEVATVRTPFLPHAVAFHPHDASTLVVFEKKGPGAAAIRSGDGLEVIAATPGRHFYGHGTFDAEARVLFSVESVIGGGAGALIVRDGTTFQPIGELPSHGVSPHDCWLLDGGVLAVTNGGGVIRAGSLGNVAFVEIASGRLLGRHEIVHERFNAGHLWVNAEGRLIVASAPRDGLPNPSKQLGAVSFGTRDSGVNVADPPRATRRRMLGESLSVVVAGERAFVSHPDGNVVTVWDAGTLVESLPFDQPRGLAISDDESTLVVSHRHSSSVVLTAVDPVRLAVAPLPMVNPSFTSGSHLFMAPSSSHRAKG
jgi:hypothetical protein